MIRFSSPVSVPRSFGPEFLSGLVMWLDSTFGITSTTAAFTGTGTVSCTSGTATFSTSQDGTLSLGDTLVGGGNSYTVIQRASATVWTLSPSSPNIAGGSSFTVAKVNPRITSWTDRQAGLSATQSTIASQPALLGDVVLFENNKDAKLILPSLSINGRAFTALAIFEPLTLRKCWIAGANQAFKYFWQPGAGSPASNANIYVDSVGKSFGSYDDGTVHTITSSQRYLTSRMLGGCVGRSTTSSFICNANSVFGDLAFESETLTGGTIMGARPTAVVSFHTKLRHFMLWNRELTTGEVAQLQYWATFEACVFASGKNLVIDGDSISYGFLTENNNNWKNQLQVNYVPTFFNCAEASKQLVTAITEAGSIVDNCLIPNATNILILWLGTNDIAAGGRTAAQVYADHVTYCTARRSAGWTKIVIIGMLPRNATAFPTFAAARAQLRTSLVGDFNAVTAFPLIVGAAGGITYADFYLDISGDANIGVNSDSTTYYADGTHLREAGQAIIAGYMNPLFNSF